MICSIKNTHTKTFILKTKSEIQGAFLQGHGFFRLWSGIIQSHVHVWINQRHGGFILKESLLDDDTFSDLLTCVRDKEGESERNMAYNVSTNLTYPEMIH